ncbi:hypothetical protein GCM10027088_12560 [Nocardia goodfellowii]
MVRNTGLSVRAAADQTYLSKSALWELANGKRKRAPSLDIVKRLHTLALSHTDADNVIGWDELFDLWSALAPVPDVPTAACASCGTAAATAVPAATVEKPASRHPSETVPVPPQRGDRHSRKTPSPAWPAVHDLARYITSDDWERVNGLMRHVGLETSPDETADAIASSRELNLHDAAETIISYAGRRAEGEVLRILHALNRQGLRDDADTLLESTLVNSRPSVRRIADG